MTCAWQGLRCNLGAKCVGEYPPDVQRRILQSGSISLLDLAKMAPWGKMFYGAYWERCQTDWNWLRDVAYGTFGQQLIDTLLHVFTRFLPWQYDQVSRREVFDLTEGAACPEVATLLELDDASGIMQHLKRRRHGSPLMLAPDRKSHGIYL